MVSVSAPVWSLTSSAETPGQAALALAEAGELVLPLHTPIEDHLVKPCSCNRMGCKDVGKHPRTMHGKDDATSHAETIKGWWGRWPTANVGRRPPVGEVVLDGDPRNGGNDQVEAIVKRFGPLTPTRTVQTGSGGWHMSYLYDGPVRGKLAPGIDLKTNTGYVIMPPSLHLSGRRYGWLVEADIAPLPEFLVPYVRPAVVKPIRTSGGGSTPARAAGLLRVVTEAEEGERNRLLYWACRRAAEHGIDPNPLVLAAIENGLTRKAAENTCLSAFKGAAKAEASR